MLNYLIFRLKAKNEYAIHSPFLFNFYTQVLKKGSSPFTLLNILSDIKYILFHQKRKIYSELFLNRLNFPKRYQNVFIYSKVNTILILSSKNGISFYQKFERKNDTETFILTEENNFENFPAEKSQSIDIVFLSEKMQIHDINSFYEKLLEIFHKSILIMENPHKSKKKYSVWNQVSNLNKIKLSLDLYFIGILFPDKGMEKQHFLLKI